MPISSPAELLEFLDSNYSDFSEAIDYINRTDEDLDYRNQYGDTALTIAATKHSGEEIVSLLLNKGAKIDLPSENGDTPLINAAMRGNASIVKLLLDRGANIDLPSENGDTPLMIVVKDPTLRMGTRESVLRLLISSGANIDLASADHYTPLMIAARNGYTSIVKLLIEKGADVKFRNERDESAFSLAADNGMRRLLLREQVKVDKRFSQGNFIDSVDARFSQRNFIDSRLTANILHTKGNKVGVCFGFNIEITRWIMKHIGKGEVDDQVDVMKKLNRMMYGGKDIKNFITRLALYQSDYFDPKNYGTPIPYKENNFFDSLPEEMKNKKFIGFSFDTFDMNDDKFFPHTIHIRRIGTSESYEVIDVNFGSRRCSNKDELNDHIESILYSYNNTNRLGEEGRGIRVMDLEELVRRRNYLPDPILTDGPEERKISELKNNKQKKYRLKDDLILAVRSSSPNGFIEALLERGSDVNQQDNNGNTPLIYAVRSKDAKLSRFLLERGADMNKQNNEGNTPLICAIEGGSEELSTLFIERGADVNRANEEGNTPLIYAIGMNNSKLSKLLIENGAYINSQYTGGVTLLMGAIARGCTEIATLLLKRGANVNQKDENGVTALFDAASMGDAELSQLLLDNGADLNIKADDGKTALDYARQSGNNDLVNLFQSRMIASSVSDFIFSKVSDSSVGNLPSARPSSPVVLPPSPPSLKKNGGNAI